MSHSACSRCGCAIAECECEPATLPKVSADIEEKLAQLYVLSNKLDSTNIVRKQRATQKRKRVLN